MKKAILPLIIFIVVFLYRLYIEYQSTIEIQPDGVNYPLNIAGIFGESIGYFAILYPIVLFIKFIILKVKGIKK